ncbi:MAG: hypothetical protein ACI9TY_001705 [Alphaproteobacteria bacterium]|jgi:hypothetical protein
MNISIENLVIYEKEKQKREQEIYEKSREQLHVELEYQHHEEPQEPEEKASLITMDM